MSKTLYYLDTAIGDYYKMLYYVDNEINNKPSMTSRECVRMEYQIFEDILKQYKIATIIRKYLNSDKINEILNQIDNEEINCSSMDCMKNVFDRMNNLRYFLNSGLSQRTIVENRLV